jgi:hypothetical protein
VDDAEVGIGSRGARVGYEHGVEVPLCFIELIFAECRFSGEKRLLRIPRASFMFLGVLRFNSCCQTEQRGQQPDHTRS